MSFWHALYLLTVYPLQLFFELVFSVALKNVNSYGYAIICLSIVINIMVLPLYIRADKIQKEQRILEEKLTPHINHIKSAFKGDERFMMLQMFYKINNYNPAMSLRSATSLLLQIPFFMAAYNLLSTLRWLDGVPFWFIRDLGQPDSLFTIGSFSVNMLPILMTLFNVISTYVYTKGCSLREKIQTYGMAAIFLVLLYNSPAGLAFYWMLNNVFSLVKNIVTVVIEKAFSQKIKKCKSAFDNLINKVNDSDRQTTMMFIVSSLISAILLSFTIPMMLIVASIEEFVEPFTYGNPLLYVPYSICTGLGIFVVWGSIIYFLLGTKGKRIFSVLSVGLAFFFSANFFYEPTMMDSASNILPKGITYVLVMVATFVLAAVIFKYSKFIYNTILIATLFGVVVLGFTGVYNANVLYADVNFPPLGEEVTINLSTEGNNVVVIMLDRALGVTVEDEFDMIPGLQERYDGFAFYPNTISFGAHTNFGSPAMVGGYEYTPYMINLRSDELLEDKQNEALSVLPSIFSDASYDVTLINPPYAGYQFITDVSVFDEIPNTDAYYIDNFFNEYAEELGNSTNSIRERDLFFFGLSYAMIYGRDFFFDDGNYNNPNRDYYNNLEFEQFLDVKGEVYRTANDYNVLRSLSDITSINSDVNGTYLFINNELTHGDILPVLSDISVDMDLNDYYNQALSRSNGNEPLFESYMSNGIALELLGEWFDYLRDQGVYDNTRIIVVSDHGYFNNYLDSGAIEYVDDTEYGLESYIPVLFVKDFGATGFTVSDDFATNADVPYFATLNLIDNPINPYTGNPIVNFDGSNMPIRICYSHRFNADVNSGTTFMEVNDWYSIIDTNDIYDLGNWCLIGNE